MDAVAMCTFELVPSSKRNNVKTQPTHSERITFGLAAPFGSPDMCLVEFWNLQPPSITKLNESQLDDCDRSLGFRV